MIGAGLRRICWRMGMLLLPLVACDDSSRPQQRIEATYALVWAEPGIRLPQVRSQEWVGSRVERVLRVHSVLRLEGDRASIRSEDVVTTWENPGALTTTAFRIEDSSSEYRVRGSRDSLYLDGATALSGLVAADTLVLRDRASGTVQTWVRSGTESIAGAEFECFGDDPHWSDIRQMLIRTEDGRMTWWGCGEFDRTFGRVRFLADGSVQIGPYAGRYRFDVQTLTWEATIDGPAGELTFRGYLEGRDTIRIAVVRQASGVYAFGTIRLRRS